MKRYFKTLALVVGLVILFTGCATLMPGVVGNAKYADALSTYNDLVVSFKHYYFASDDATKIKLNKTVRPALLQYSYALDMWKASQNDTLREDSVIALQRRAIQLMLDAGVIKLKEGQ